MHNTFDKNLGHENEKFNIKHHLTNAGLMVLLLALLALPMTGFYAQQYLDSSATGLVVPDYIAGAGNVPAEVLSSESVRSVESSETVTPEEREKARIADIEHKLYKEVLGSSIERDLSITDSEASSRNTSESTSEEASTEVASETDAESTNTEEVKSENENSENSEFDPAQYSPANIYPVYR